MKETKNYICIVDGCPSRKRNTAGRYRVGARSNKEAKSILQKAIGFCSIDVRYEDKAERTRYLLKQGECVKEIGYYGGSIKRILVRHANSPCSKK